MQQLLEYKMYKYISYELKERRQDAAQVLYHKQDLPEEVKAYKQPVSTEELLAGVTLSRMHRILWISYGGRTTASIRSAVRSAHCRKKK